MKENIKFNHGSIRVDVIVEDNNLTLFAEDIETIWLENGETMNWGLSMEATLRDNDDPTEVSAKMINKAVNLLEEKVNV